MLKMSIKGECGYDIPCVYSMCGERKILISAHGFGSDKTSETSVLLHEALPKAGIGVMSFDFPAHGESGVDGAFLRIPNCVSDLAMVEREALRRVPEAEIVYFGSSFGAYITALYLSLYDHTGSRAFFRSAAVTMPEIVLNAFFPNAEEELRKNGWFMLDHTGYKRPLKITREFLEDLRCHDLFGIYNGAARLTMMHGDEDKVAPYEAAQRFASRFGARLITVKGGEHSLAAPGQPQDMVRAALDSVLERE